MPDPRIHPWEVDTAAAVLVGAASTLVLAANGHRTGVDLTNLSDPAEAFSLGFGNAAVAGSGKVLTAYGSTYHMGTENLFLGAIYAICASGDMLLAVSEETRN